MNALKFGLLGAIGGFAKGQADDIKSQEDEKFKMDYLQKQLDSKREISDAVTNAKVDMFDKMNEERQRWHD